MVRRGLGPAPRLALLQGLLFFSVDFQMDKIERLFPPDGPLLNALSVFLERLVALQRGSFREDLPDQFHGLIVAPATVIFPGQKLKQARIRPVGKRLDATFGPVQRLSGFPSLLVNLSDLEKGAGGGKIARLDGD